MKVRMVSPKGEEMTLNLNSEDPITLDSLRNNLRSQLQIPSQYSFYYKKSLISREEQIQINKEDCISDDEKSQLAISYIRKSEFPPKVFAQTDYSYSLDIPLFRTKDADSNPSYLFPPIEGPMCIRNGNPNLTNFVEEAIEQAATYSNPFFGLDPTLENLADSIVNDNFDISQMRNLTQNLDEENIQPQSETVQHRTRFGNIINVEPGHIVENGEIIALPNSRSSLSDKSKRKKKNNTRRHLFEANTHPEEEEKDNDDAFEEYDGEEEDFAEGIDEIMEMKENYEESMTPEIEQSVERLMKLGFDRNLVTPLLFMLGDEEKTMQFLQKPFNDMMK